MSGLGEVPLSHHWLGYWAQRGSSAWMERNLVLQGGWFRDLQGNMVWTWREPEHRTAGLWEHGCLWTSFHTSPLTVRCCQKRHFWWLCSAPQGLAFSDPCSQLQQREGVVGLLSFQCLQQQVSQADMSQLPQPDTALKGFKPTWPVPEEQQTLSHEYFSLISECTHAKLLYSAIEFCVSKPNSRNPELFFLSFNLLGFFFPLSVSLMLVQNMWEPFFSYCLPPCNLHFSSIVPTNRFWNDLFLLTFC